MGWNCSYPTNLGLEVNWCYLHDMLDNVDHVNPTINKQKINETDEIDQIY